jgi:glucose/mannose-6-phosphate isomerase
LPAWASGPETLVICSSHSGNTEETLSAFEAAQAASCRILALSTGGALASAAEKAKLPLWTFDHQGQPRTAVGFSFGLLLAAAARLGLIPDPAAELADAVAAMQEQQGTLVPEVPDTANSAKRMGGQFMGRWITIYGAGLLAPVARRWKTQINENAKVPAFWAELPEADHNEIAGWEQAAALGSFMAVFLEDSDQHPRVRQRTELTAALIEPQAAGTLRVESQGVNRVERVLSLVLLGDLVSAYLAVLRDTNPSPVLMIERLKEELAREEVA